jgi:uncharacterized OB-fold protein
MQSISAKKIKQVPIREGLFATPLSPADQVRLLGSQCQSCGEVSLGKRSACPNCGSNQVREVPLSHKGKLWTYTVIRHRPPGEYKGPDPFVPFGEGLVELPEGIRVLSPIECELDKLKIGMELQLEVFKLFENEDGNEVIAFRFRPI